MKKIFNIWKGKARVVENKPWYFLRWEISLIVFLAVIASLFNIIPYWVGNSDPVPLPGGDSYAENPLRDNIAYSTISMSITILVAIFIGIFTEVGQYIGKYSSALFALVPSIVWLLSDRSDNHIEHLVETADMLGNLIFYSIISAAAISLIFWIVTKILMSLSRVPRIIMKWEAINNIVSRIIIIITNIAILMMLGYALINYGVFTLHLCDVPNPSGSASKTAYDLHSEKFTTFIAVVAIVFALLMVGIGLSNIFTNDRAVALDESNEESGEISISDANNEAVENLNIMTAPRGPDEKGDEHE